MTSLPDMRRLLQVSEHRQLQNERQLNRARQALTPLSAELREIDLHTRALQELLEVHQSACGLFDQAQLRAWMRHQAVLRRQLNNAGLDRARVEEQYNAATDQIQQLEVRYQSLQKKGLLYTGLHRRLLGEHRSNQRRREENEVEELLASMK
jgi:chromosome segregation ATPase